jgi:hypothetical protein
MRGRIDQYGSREVAMIRIKTYIQGSGFKVQGSGFEAQNQNVNREP